MVVAEIRFLQNYKFFTHSLFLLLGLLCLVWAKPAEAGFVTPLQGNGNFNTHVDVLDRWRDDQTLDVVVLIEVANSYLKCEVENGVMVGRLRVEIEIEGPQGQVVQAKRVLRTPKLTAAEAASSTLFQSFGVVLKDVPFRHGRFICHVFDVNQRRPGLWNTSKRKQFVSSCATDWAASESPRVPKGIFIGDPLYLFQAPLKTWNPNQMAQTGHADGYLYDYMHASRRYGIEQDHLQLFIPIWPPLGGVPLTDSVSQVQVQIISLDLKYSITDTLDFDARGLAALGAGLPVGLFYELDVNLLPGGSYRMSIAPLGGFGHGVLGGFDVSWRLDTLGQRRDLVLAEGNVVFDGRQRRTFLEASPADQEKMLAEFWFDNNPDPESSVNAAYLEFQYRMAYVQQFLGGLKNTGPMDDRGLVFLMLGPPDEMQVEHLPLSALDQDDARVKVFQRFAPDRHGVLAKGQTIYLGNVADPFNQKAGIPMPYSQRAEAQRKPQAGRASHNYGFELWKYDRSGYSLFPNRFTRSSMGSRFLFIDRNGTGDFYLESSNVIQGEE